jgi:hypothetical protein
MSAASIWALILKCKLDIKQKKFFCKNFGGGSFLGDGVIGDGVIEWELDNEQKKIAAKKSGC